MIQSTYVKTLKSGTRYQVAYIEGGFLVVRQPSGKKRKLAVGDVGRARYDSAVAHFHSQNFYALRNKTA